jgi:predicted DNA-binding ribbon-helix-helix protein
MKSPVVKRSVVITGRNTSVSLEDAFWNGLKEIAEARHQSLAGLLIEIDSSRQGNCPPRSAHSCSITFMQRWHLRPRTASKPACRMSSCRAAPDP